MSGDGDEVLYAELAGDLRRRSHRAFERIFKEMGPRLYRFAFSYLMNAEMAEDVVQDTFMHFWSVLGTLPEDTRVSTYLYASVKNSCLNYYKHLRGRYQPDKTYRSLDLYGVPAIRRGRGPVRKGAGLLA